MRVIGTGALLLALMAGTAAAGPFVHTNRFDADSRVGADVSYFVLDGDPDFSLLRFDLHGHYIHPESGGGFYAQVPVAFAFDDNDSETVLGNLEIGGLYMPKAMKGPLQFVLRGGITLPTAEDDLSSLLGVIAQYARVHDLYLAIPEGVTARLGGSALYDAGNVYFRGDLGIDINLSHAGGGDVDPAVSFNAGLGLRVSPQAAITAELSSISSDEDDVFNFGLGARFFTGNIWPYVGLVLPLDSEPRELMDLALVAGLDARI